MKRIFYALSCLLILSSCATMFYGKKSKVVLSDPDVTTPVTLTVGGKRYENVMLPAQVKIKKSMSAETIVAEAEGFEPYAFKVDKKFNGKTFLNIFWGLIPGMVIDGVTGAMMVPKSQYYTLNMQPLQPEGYKKYMSDASAYEKDPTIMEGEADNAVSRDAPGQTALERTVIRWAFDSDPRGARIFWRVISSIPSIVKNTNELYLTSTPYEETRSFNILGLTYENSRDVVIEIKLTKRGYEDQVKRFNVRQAIDQQEISSFFELVKKEEE